MRPAFFLFLAAIFAASLTLPATAQGVRGGVQPLDRILPQIQRTHPGRFYDADGPSPGPGGSLHYHLKWMTPDGRIEWLDTDARTGRVLGTSPGRDNFDGPPAPYYAPPPSYPVPGYYGGFQGGYSGYGYRGGGYPGGGPRGYGGGGRSFGGGRGGGGGRRR
jgi:hypothetical protein